MPRLMSFPETWPRFIDGSQLVTRRSHRAEGMRYGHLYKAWAPAWPTLKAGDVIEGIEWTPNWAPHGERWVCRDCGWLGDTDPSLTETPRRLRWRAHGKARPLCNSGLPSLEWRAPGRLPGTEGHRRIVSVRDEFLVDITPEDVVLEGFPEWSPERFIHMYCGGRRPDRARPVNRIKFEELA